ncbi:MAG: hypothetical protein FWG78_04845 [Coriobacteriia bacterium]|nr:hypothetical protein [Coriobacteriia bacterium]
MKKCPVCRAYATSSAATCFECLYSFNHMTSLESSNTIEKTVKRALGFEIPEQQEVTAPVPATSPAFTISVETSDADAKILINGVQVHTHHRYAESYGAEKDRARVIEEVESQPLFELA